MDVATRVGISSVDGADDNQRVALFCGDVKYFLQDMKRDIFWMLCAALQNCQCPLRGDETDFASLEDARSLLEGVRQGSFWRLGICWNSCEHQKLRALGQCVCRQGSIIIFPCKASDGWKELKNAFKTHICKELGSKFLIDAHPPQLKNDFLLEVAVIVVFSKCEDGLHFFHVFNPEQRKKHWAFV